MSAVEIHTHPEDRQAERALAPIAGLAVDSKRNLATGIQLRYD